MARLKGDQFDVRTQIIPKDKAVFWMDAQGRWHNQHGPFQHRKIIEHFNASIERDASGYYVTQENNGVREKVYFRYEDTALFVIDVVLTDPIRLVLNTSVQIDLVPEHLEVQGDQLYCRDGEDRIKFAERALLKIADLLEYRDEMYYICVNQKHYPITRTSNQSRSDT